MKKYASLIKFILVVIAGGIAGGAAAAFLSKYDPQALGTAVSNWLISASPLLLTASIVLGLLAALIFYKRAQNRLQRTGLETDDDFDQIDHDLSLSMTILNMIFVLAFLFFGIFAAGLNTIMHEIEQVSTFGIIVAGTIFIFLIGSFVTIYLQTRLVKLTKMLYPGKKGDPLEFKFAKDWLESCDEAEQYIIYRAAYKTNRVTNQCLIFFWLFAVFGAMFFDTGLLPIILITALWGVNTMVYCTQSAKLNKTQLR